MRALLLCAIVACSLAVANATIAHDYHQQHSQELHAALRRFDTSRGFGQDHGLDVLAETYADAPATAGGFKVQATCSEAFFTMVGVAQSCNLTFKGVNQFYDPNNIPTQTQVDSYCTSACKTGLEAKLLAFAASCTAAEIKAIEDSSLSTNPTNPFKWGAILGFIRMPCVSRTDASLTLGKEYCLPAFITLVHTFQQAGAGVAFTAESLAASCKECTAIFLGVYIAFAAPLDVKNLAFIDLVCTRDGSTWCWLENKALDALPDTTAEEKIAKATRTCSTTCLQKSLVKIVAANRLFNQTVAQLRAERAAFNSLNGLCAKNGAGEYCAVVAQRFDSAVNESTDAGCVLSVPQSCPATCQTFATTWLADKGCCYGSLASSLVDPETGLSPLAPISAFLHDKCGATIPSACPRVTAGLRASIAINNLRWAWYLANIAAFKAAVLLDIAALIGSRVEDLSADVSQGTSTSSSGFHTMAASTIVVSLTGSADTATQVGAYQSTLQSSLATGVVPLASVAALTNSDYSAKVDTTQSVSVDASSSEVSMNAAAATSPALALIVTAVAALVARML